MARPKKATTGPDYFAEMPQDQKNAFRDQARKLVRGSIIEDAAVQFLAQCLAYAIGEVKKEADERIAALEAQVSALSKAR